jgi:hypothetical protein
MFSGFMFRVFVCAFSGLSPFIVRWFPEVFSRGSTRAEPPCQILEKTPEKLLDRVKTGENLR